MKIKINIKKIWISIIFLYVLFPFYPKGLNMSIQQILLYLIMLFYLSFQINNLNTLLKKVFCNQYVNFAAFFLGIVIFMTLTAPIIHGTYDFGYLKVILSIIINSFQLLFLIILFIRNYECKDYVCGFLYKYASTCALYVVFTIIFNFFPTLKLVWKNFIYITENQRYMMDNSFGYQTRFGLMGFSGFEQTWMCTMSCAILVYFYVDDLLHHKKNNFKTLLLLALNLVGNAFYGRSGMLASIICIGIGILYVGILRGRILRILEISGILILLYVFAGIFQNYNQTFHEWYIWAMTPLNNLLQTREIGMNSVDEMFEKMYFWPGLDTFLLGDGRYIGLNGGYYMSTDIGFMRPMLFFGIFGELAGYMCVIFLIIYQSHFKSGYSMKLLAVLFLFITFFFEIKGETYHRMISILFAMSVLYQIDKEKYTKPLKRS